MAQCTYDGQWRPAVVRSLITLKALMYAGFDKEARDCRRWSLRATAGNPADVQIMYGVAGVRRLPEYVADWLPGYDGHPVRIGNDAVNQFQLDVYGKVMDALYRARTTGENGGASTWALQRSLMTIVARRWREPDAPTGRGGISGLHVLAGDTGRTRRRSRAQCNTAERVRCFWRTRSILWWAGTMKRPRYSNGCWSCGTISACFPRNTTRGPGGWSGISRRPSVTSR